MQAETLLQQYHFLSTNGHTLSVQERTALQSSLVLLKSNNKLHRVTFWGKIFGFKGDYLLAQGWDGSILSQVKNFYSVDGINWSLLPELTPQQLENAPRVRGLFAGDPSFVYEMEDLNPPPPTETAAAAAPTEAAEGEEAAAEAEPAEKKKPAVPKVRLTEEVRLAYFMSCVDTDTSVVPRGAFVLDGNLEVIPNTTFAGLEPKLASKISSYLHLRPAERLNAKSALQKEHLHKTIDFLDSLEEDVPRGCWSIQYEAGYNVVVIRSLLWPGYAAYHVPGSTVFGSFYMGNGEKNLDLPFML